MGDIICKVCGEPWDAYAVYESLRIDGDGDMSMKEAKMLTGGRGCPSCKGKRPKGADKKKLEEEFLSSITDSENTDEDPVEVLSRVKGEEK